MDQFKVSNYFVSPFYSELNYENHLLQTQLSTPACYNVIVRNLTSLKNLQATILFYIFYNYPLDTF